MSRVTRVKYRHTKVNYELGDLEAGDPLLPPNADTTSRLEVVPVHNNMHHQINRDGNPRLQVLSLAREIKRTLDESFAHHRCASGELGVT